MALEDLLTTRLADRFQSAATVKVVYGEAQTINGRTIIPVARVMYGFGGGSGRGTPPQGEGGGEGGGGGVRVKPLGVIEITADGTRFIPVVDMGRLALYGLAGLFLVTGVLRAYIRYLSRKRR